MKDIYKTIGRNIRDARKRAGLTQEEVAQAVGWKYRTSLVNLEQGRQNTPLYTLVEIAAVLGVAPGDLLPPSLWPSHDAVKQRELEVKLADVKQMLQEIVDEL